MELGNALVSIGIMFLICDLFVFIQTDKKIKKLENLRKEILENEKNEK